MRRLSYIVILLALLSLQVAAQKVNTLYSGLKKASSFIVLNEAIYIVDSGNHRILKLDLEGRLIDKYGNRGGGNYQFDNPVSIASSTGLKIFVSDLGNNRIQVFDKRWQYLSSITGNEKFQTKEDIEPSYLGVSKLGEIIFYDVKTESLGKYDEDGTYLDQIPIPSEVKSVDGIQVVGGKIFVLDRKSGHIHRLSGNGFYESFYLAERGTAFYYKNDIVYLIQDSSLKSYKKQQIIKLYDFKLETVVTKILVIEDGIFILTDNSLLKISL